MHDFKVADYCIDYLSQSHDNPFFLACGIYNPHGPWWVPQKYFDMYPLDEIQLPEVPDNDLDDLPPTAVRIAHSILNSHQEVIEKGKWCHFVQAYLACITFADTQIGRVLDALEKSPYADNTIVCLWSDHGWHLGEKLHWHKSTLWERSCHSQFIWKVPGITKPGTRCEKPVELQSIYPTLSSLCGLQAPETVEGYDLTSLLKDPGADWHYPAITVMAPEYQTLRTDDWRYITYGKGQEELYNHKEDPNEWTNLADDPNYKDLKERLKQMLPEAAESAPLDWLLLGPQRIKRLRIKENAGDKTFVTQSDDTFVLLSGEWQKINNKTYSCLANESNAIAEWYRLFKTKKTENYKVEIRLNVKDKRNLANNTSFILYTAEGKKKLSVDLTKSEGKWQNLGIYKFNGDMQKVFELLGTGNGRLMIPELRILKQN